MYINLTICLNVCVTVWQYGESLSASSEQTIGINISDEILSPLLVLQQNYEISTNRPPALSFSLFSLQALRASILQCQVSHCEIPIVWQSSKCKNPHAKGLGFICQLQSQSSCFYEVFADGS